MTKTVSGIFKQRGQAEKAVEALRAKGFHQEISIIAKEDDNYKHIDQNSQMSGGDSVLDGLTTGGFIGGLAGLAVGAGALVIPGLGPLVAAGPIAGLLSGATTGGFAGGLIDYGIPEAEGQRMENELRQGSIVALVQTSENKVDEAASILRENGAIDVKSFVK